MKQKAKTQTPGSDDLALQSNQPGTSPKLTALLETLHGRAGEAEMHEAEGLPVRLEAGIVRGYRADNYSLCVRLGGQWIVVDTVRHDSELIEQLRPMMTVHPENPVHVAERERREHEQAEREREARERAEARRIHHERLKSDEAYRRSYYRQLGGGA